jgi:uncharacterized membrane protein
MTNVEQNEEMDGKARDKKGESIPKRSVTPDPLVRIEAILRDQSAKLERLGERVAALEADSALRAPGTEPEGPSPAGPEPAGVEGPRPPETSKVVVTPVLEPRIEAPGPPEEALEPPSPPKMKTQKIRFDVEVLVGGNWLNRVGVVALVIGVIFFLKYALENRWIGEAGQCMLGVLLGVGLIAAAEYFERKRYRWFAVGLVGGGIAILYASIFVAFNYYELIGQVPAFLFMILVTGAGVVLAVRYNAQAVAILAMIGGFLTPILCSTGKDQQVILFTYIAILDLGILALAYFKNWSALNYLCFLFTHILFAGWAVEHYSRRKLWRTEFFATLFFALFSATAVFYHLVRKVKANWASVLLIFLNAVLYFGWTYGLLREDYHDYLGLYSILMAAVFVTQAYITHGRFGEDRYLVWTFLGLSMLFCTLAVPIQLEQNWITFAWFVEALILCWAGFRAKSPNTRAVGIAVFAIALLKLFAWDVDFNHYEGARYLLLLNRRAFTFICAAATLFAAAYLYFRWKRRLDGKAESPAKGGAWIPVLLLGAANLVLVVLLSVEAVDYIDHLERAYELEVTPRADLGAVRADLANARQLSLSAIWGIYAVILVALGLLKRYYPLRLMGLSLFVITIVKVFSVDLSYLERLYRIFSFIGLGGILLGVSLLYGRYREKLTRFALKD